MTPGDLCNFVVARQYSIVKELGDYQSPARAVLRRLLMPEQSFKFMVGLDRLELSTSPLSGARSSHLSYRPMGPVSSHLAWWSWSGSNRRPPECKSGALPAELQPRKKFESRPVERETTKTSSMIIKGRAELEKEN